jgi:hypothetical protein
MNIFQLGRCLPRDPLLLSVFYSKKHGVDNEAQCLDFKGQYLVLMCMLMLTMANDGCIILFVSVLSSKDKTM